MNQTNALTLAPADESALVDIYRRLLSAWNRRQASDYASLFVDDGGIIGFDGSAVDGRGQIEAHLQQIFGDHVTARYVGKVKEVRGLGPQVALLRAVVGMVPPGQADLNPAVNALQTMIAVRLDDQWRIVLFQNTPAQFHGRPEAAQALTDELRQVLQAAALDHP